MILFIDTSDFNSLHFAVIDGNKNSIKEARHTVAYNENHKTLALLTRFLEKQKVNLAKITRIIVCSGPGSFTGIRVGASLAQGMGYALDVPIMSIKKDKVPADLQKLATSKLSQVRALNYGKAPNITQSKK